jgi:hypothetical protein
MNLGNVIQLLLLMMFVGAGASLGQFLGGTAGAVVGGVAGVGLRLAVGVIANRIPVPSCSCGNDLDFDIAERAPREFAYKCRPCGKSYELRKQLWSEILDDGTRVPRMRRGFLGIWKLL